MSATYTAPSGLTVTRVAGHIGAELGNVDLSKALSDATVHDIRQALLKWKVVFFRGQHIDHAQQVAFTGRFGEVTYAHPHEDAPPEAHPEILPIDRNRYDRRNGIRRASYDYSWHTDVTALINPPAASILRAVDVPSFGGDTTWSNLVAAYEGLSAPLRSLADTLHAEHRFNANGRLSRATSYGQRVAANPLVTVHPVVRVHPETGERALFVNTGFTSHLIDVNTRESELLLELFFEQISRQAYTVRFKWNNGDIAFWDNRATAHLAPQDLDHLDGERVLYRTTVTGDVPVGVDGQPSRSISGEFFGKSVPTVFRRDAQREPVPA